jgi:amino acid permease
MINNLTNITLNNYSSYGQLANQTICELNQYVLLENTSKLPKIVFWFALATFLFLFVRQFILPWMREFKYKDYVSEALAGFAFACSIWVPIISFYTTFQLSAAQLQLYTRWAFYILIPICIFSLWMNRGNILKLFRGVEYDDRRDTDQSKVEEGKS